METVVIVALVMDLIVLWTVALAKTAQKSTPLPPRRKLW